MISLLGIQLGVAICKAIKCARKHPRPFRINGTVLCQVSDIAPKLLIGNQADIMCSLQVNFVSAVRASRSFPIAPARLSFGLMVKVAVSGKRWS